MVVGEVSGDMLGASLIKALKQRYPDKKIIIEGIVGPKLIELGAKALYPMESLNVMGFFEPLKRLPKLFHIRKALLQHFVSDPPDLFIGIDAPDFNLGLEKKCRANGIKTVHYVSPTLWAWRASRINIIKQAVDLMLTIFPFEKEIYDNAKVPARFVGHPFADEIPLEINSEKAKIALGFKPTDTIIALLPGSRDRELYYLAEAYLKTAQLCYEKRRDLKFVLPVVSEKHKKFIQSYLETLPFEYCPPIKILTNDTRTAMAACDAALVTSGTATLEMLLHKKPMIVGYRMNPLSYHIAKRLIRIPHIAMANIVAGEALAKEFIQNEVVPEKMAEHLLTLLTLDARKSIVEKYTDLHATMRKNASAQAAEAVAELLEL